jgi:molecular chaperone HtpG
MNAGIIFNVETSRILEILASDIYDTPLALLRENVQNAYDAIRMRFASTGILEKGGKIDVFVGGGKIVVIDNGIGMTEKGLRENFWKAGSSGKHSDSARKAGVVGTFGIGAMANFGVCTQLNIDTKVEGSEGFLRSSANRDTLKIAEECISLEHIKSTKEVGTIVTAILDDKHPISPEQALQYLRPYVSSLPIPVYFNDVLISCNTLESRLSLNNRKFDSLGGKEVNDNLFRAFVEIRVDTNGQVLILVDKISMGGNPIEGNLALLQSGGSLMGLRSNFGLAPIPSSGYYQLGGFANLSFLQPTAGREAISRESIEYVNQLMRLAEQTASDLLATTQWADKNNALIQWIISHGRYDLADKVTIHVLPEKIDIPLGGIKAYVGRRTVHYYTGTDQQILTTFSNEDTYLLQIAQSNPRRNLQLHYISQILNFPQVPDHAQVTKIYDRSELSLGEASVLIQIASILREDYLIPDVEPVLADISHGVSCLSEKSGDHLTIFIARKSALLPPLLEFYNKAYAIFSQFMKDFVRNQIYPKIQAYVPSSTKDGVDALRRILEHNRELYHYEETELGDLKGLLEDYLSGNLKLSEVLQHTAISSGQHHQQSVSHNQVGTIESVVSGIAENPVKPPEETGFEYEAHPPIIQDSVVSDMKILTTNEKYPLLNNFTMLLGLSDRLMRSPDAELLRIPHTTRIIWGGHKIIYIFTEATGHLSLYYDIELRDPIPSSQVSGGTYPTTTLITKKRIFVPVPDVLMDVFKVTTGSKEFYVSFDTLG